jgi:hypothetical protein
MPNVQPPLTEMLAYRRNKNIEEEIVHHFASKLSLALVPTRTASSYIFPILG